MAATLLLAAASALLTPHARPHRPPPRPTAVTTDMRLPDALPRVPPSAWSKQAAVMFAASALLGPLCDGRHSAHDVLHYAEHSIAGPPWRLAVPPAGVLETCWWVPLAFGAAGVILGAAHPRLDRAWAGGAREPPGWPAVGLSISGFVGCYELSGALAEAAAARGGPHDWLSLDAPLLLIALAMFLTFERSLGGLFMMALLAVVGPAVEVQLINSFHLYEYTHPDAFGIPSWIAWVYAAGGPPNGALGRQVLHELSIREE
ncbi:hypothetical protein AB1Y20_013300 [Prymnesium parvum]|uniref:Derlin n=1 Tax=Prymnesium parvum TaxID=97485 RepID=A0AB34IMY3_PRYPA